MIGVHNMNIICVSCPNRLDYYCLMKCKKLKPIKYKKKGGNDKIFGTLEAFPQEHMKHPISQKEREKTLTRMFPDLYGGKKVRTKKTK